MADRVRVWTIIVVLLLLVAGGGGTGAQADSGDRQGASEVQVRLLESSENRITLEIQVPLEAVADLLSVVTGTAPVQGREDLFLLSEAGAPNLLAKSVLLGVPAGASASLQVLDWEEVTLPGQFSVAPAPTRRADYGLDDLAVQEELAAPGLPSVTVTRQQDPAIYGVDALYPSAPIELGETGYIRQQQVARLAFYPLRFNPVRGAMTATSRIVVSLDFEYPGGSVAANWTAAPEPESFERMLRESLLNYEVARHWRQARPEPDPQAVSGLPSGDLYKILVPGEGIYQLTKSDLVAAGVPVGVDPQTFQLFNLGAEVDIYVAGEGDGQFNDGDYILFYAPALRTKYSATNVFWLTHSESTGQRMQDRSVLPSGTMPVPPSFGATKRLEGGYWYIPRAPGDDELDRWLWARIYPPYYPPVTHSFSLANLASGAGTLRAAVLGHFDLESSPDHHVQIYINDNLVEDALWDGVTWHYPDVTWASDYLQEGTNVIRVEGPNDLGIGLDRFFDDWFEIDYQDTFVAEGDVLAFNGAGADTWEYQVSGFSTDALVAFDVTDPEHVVRLTDWVAAVDGLNFTLKLEDTSAADSRYWTLSEAQWLQPAGIMGVEPADLQSTQNGADYIIIADEAYVSTMQPLADYRAGQGLRTMIVTTQDIMDVFYDGILDPRAIQEFVSYAYDYWQPPAPAYVVFAGDGHTDFHNYRTTRPNLVPPFLAFADPWLGEAAVDNRYVAVSGDDPFPDLIAGRLPFEDGTEAAILIDKIEDYEAGGGPEDWNSRMLFVADNADGGGNFPALSDALIADYVEPGYTDQKVHLGVTCPYEDPAVACRGEIVDSINNGILLVNYVGHAWELWWTGEELFGIATLADLSNDTALPVVLSMDCLDGYFASPFLDVVAESVVRASGRGAVASWSPTGLGVATGHDLLNRGFLDYVIFQGGRELGAATLAGKLKLWNVGYFLDLIDTYTLFGDPLLQINALDTDVQIEKTVEPPDQVYPGDVLTYTLAFTNAGPATAHQVFITDLIPVELVSPTILFASPSVISQHVGITFSWTISDLVPHTGGEIQFRAVVSPTAEPGFVVVNEAEISTRTPDADPSNNVVSVTTGVQVPDVAVVKTGPTSISYNETITYTITWGNIGVLPAPGVRLTDTLPAWVDYVDDDSGFSMSEPQPGVIVWEVTPDPVPTGTQGSFVLTGWVNMAPMMVSPMVNLARISTDAPDGSPFNDSSDWSTDLVLPDMGIRLDGPEQVLVPTEIDYTITYSNDGDLDAQHVVITDVLPVGVSYLSDDSGFAHDEPVPGTHVWQVTPESLAPGQGGFFVVTVSVGGFDEVGATLQNTVTVWAATPDGDWQDNTDSLETEVEAKPFIYLPIVLKATP